MTPAGSPSHSPSKPQQNQPSPVASSSLTGASQSKPSSPAHAPLRPPPALRTRSHDSVARPRQPALDKAGATQAAGKPLAHASNASSRLTSFLRHPPPTHTHIPPSLAGSLLLESQHSPFHRRTLSRKDPSGGPRRPSLTNSHSDPRLAHGGFAQLPSPTGETSSSTEGPASCSRVSSHSSSGSSSSDGSSSSGSSVEATTSSSSSEDDSAASPTDQSARRGYFYPEDLLLSPWLTPQEFDKSTPSITRREMEARLEGMHSYFDGDGE